MSEPQRPLVINIPARVRDEMDAYKAVTGKTIKAMLLEAWELWKKEAEKNLPRR